MTEQEKTGKFLPAFFVDVVEKGQQFTAGELPRHITLFPPVQAEYDIAHMGNELKYQFNPEIPFDARVIEEPVLFGLEQNIPVQRVESADLQRIHTHLVGVLGNLLHNDMFRKPYNPHITIVDKELEGGTVLPVASFSIVERQLGVSSLWTVVDKIGFKGEL